MADPTGIEYKERRRGEVVISYHGTKTAVLRGERARKFPSRVETRDSQEVMARMTGN